MVSVFRAWALLLSSSFAIGVIVASNSSSWVARAAAAHSDGGVAWQELSVRVRQDTILLHKTSGYVPNGCICGILGPSGSGKSTFLHALSGRQSSHRQTGKIVEYRAGDRSRVKVEPLVAKNVAHLQQRDDFFGMLTARETLRLAAFLELPNLKASERDSLILSRVQALGLEEHLDRPVGDSLSFGGPRLSGGERRRLGVALELLTDKHVLVADEPTSGLDASRALKVMQTLQKTVERRNIPGLVIIHQPRSSVWHNLDYVMLMAPGGLVCYCGPQKEALDFFASQGYTCPPATNPAEFLVDLVSIDSEGDAIGREDKQRIEILATAFAQQQKQVLQTQASKKKQSILNTESTGIQGSRRAIPFNILRVARRFGALLQRSWRQTIRNKSIHLFRAGASIGNAILLAQIFPTVQRGLEPGANSVADRVALLSFGAINMCFMAFMKTITLAPS